MPEVIELMYKHPEKKRSKPKVVAHLCIDVDGIHVIQHVSDQWIEFCKNNKPDEDLNTDKFVEKFLDEFHQDPNNDNYWIHRYIIYQIYSDSEWY